MATLVQGFERKRLQNFERMIDDHVVNRYMAQVDTEIDNYILGCRVDDQFTDTLRETSRTPGEWSPFNNRPGERWREHDQRATDLQEMIEQIRASDSFEYIEPERSFQPGFGPYDGNSDTYLAYVLDFAGPDYADEETGSTEWDGYLMRFGRVLLWSDDRGFKTAEILDNEDVAKRVFDQLDAQYGNWMLAQEDH
jgi:hypothetical protein